MSRNKNKQNKTPRLASNTGRVAQRNIAEGKRRDKLQAERIAMGKDIGGRVGTYVATQAGVPGFMGNKVGSYVGGQIGNISGMGDYIVGLPRPRYNISLNNQIPQFRTGRFSNVVCHREYLGDVLGTTSFNNTSYSINPGNPSLFPWLSQVASNYQQYRIHGMVFGFTSLITDFVTSGQPGVIIFATDYDAVSPPYASKIEMENSEYSTSVKPTLNLLHGLECAPNQSTISELYVLNPNLSIGTSYDPRFYNMGNFQVATQGNPSGATLGELHVTYCVEFFKPVMSDASPDFTGHVVQSGAVLASSPWGATFVSQSGNIKFTIAGNNMSFVTTPGTKYGVTLVWSGANTASVSVPNMTWAGVTLLNYQNNDSQNVTYAPTGSATSSEIVMFWTMIATGSSATVTYTNDGTIPTGAIFDAWALAMSPTIIS